MGTLSNGNNNTDNNLFDKDDNIDNLIERVNVKLAKLKNNGYLLEYLLKLGLSADLAKQMIEGKPKNQYKIKELKIGIRDIP